MLILDVNKLSKNFGFGQLFEDVSFSLNDGESISIVGENGCGKSTLIKIIAGVYKPDAGQISIKKGAKIGYLDQTLADSKDERKVYDVLKDAFKELNDIEARIKAYEEKLATLTGEDYNKALASYCKTIEEYSLKGGYNTDVTIKTVCSGLKIDEAMLNRSYQVLSGGEKTLVQLAKVLLLKPDLLLLDEPTNHLDIERIEWLENYIKEFKGASVIISHDRYFLDKMATKILDLNGIAPKVYDGNYTKYLALREAEFEKQMANYKDQQIVIKRLTEQIKYFAERGMATNSSTLCNRAHALQTQLDRILARKVERPVEQAKVKIDFSRENKTSKRVFEVSSLSVLAPNGRKILDDINLTIMAGERVALIGSNGSGKSTLVKTLLGMQELPVLGGVNVGQSVKIGYLPQIINFDNGNMRLLEYFKDEIGVNEEKTRQKLSSFHFYKEDMAKRVSTLSGGEKIRLRLACLLEQNVNCLVFDEPTNHIDIATKEVLEVAMDNFGGTILFVSHDRYLINKLAQKTLEFKDGKVNEYLGNYDFYKEHLGLEN